MTTCNQCIYNPVVGGTKKDANYEWVRAANSTIQNASICNLTQCVVDEDLFVRYASNGQSIPADTNTTILFNSFVEGSLSGYSTATGLFTPPETGFYYVSVQIQFNSPNPATTLNRIFINAFDGNTRTQDVGNYSVTETRNSVANIVYATAGIPFAVCTVNVNNAVGTVGTASHFTIVRLKTF